VTSIEILRGYSASGKSTYARESGKFIVSRDLIRQQFGATMKTVFGQETEAKVSKIQEAQVRTAISAGMDVVIDDTNLVLKFARRWADLAVELGVRVVCAGLQAGT
jgi:predicted kinase